MPFKVGGKTYQSRDEYLKAVGKRARKPTTTTTTVKVKPKRKVTTTTTVKPPARRPTTTTTTVKARPKRKVTTTTTVKKKEGVGKRIGKKAKEGVKSWAEKRKEALEFE